MKYEVTLVGLGEPLTLFVPKNYPIEKALNRTLPYKNPGSTLAPEPKFNVHCQEAKKGKLVIVASVVVATG